MTKLIKTVKSTLGAFAYTQLEVLRWNLYRLRCPLTRAALERMPNKQLSYALNVSPRYNYVYVDNPKTGCSSLKSALVELELRRTGSRLDYYDWKVFHDPEVSPLKRLTQLNSDTPLSFLVMEGYRFLSFVRNPYTRLLSCYRDKILNNKPQKLQVLRLMGYSDVDMERPIGFDEFVRTIIEQCDFEMNPHWRVQTTQILCDIFEYSFLGRFESYDQDFAAFFRHIGIPEEELPISRHLNKTKQDSREGCRQHYTPEIQNLVYERYLKDFENFGYRYDLPE